MVNRVSKYGVIDAVRADHIHANRAWKAQVEGMRNLAFSPNICAKFLDCFLKLEGVSMNCYFKIAHSMAAGQIAHPIPGQEQDHSRLAGSLAQLPQRVLLVCREPVFHEVNVVGHSFSCFPPSSIRVRVHSPK